VSNEHGFREGQLCHGLRAAERLYRQNRDREDIETFNNFGMRQAIAAPGPATVAWVTLNIDCGETFFTVAPL
jgi:hypothetical protein